MRNNQPVTQREYQLKPGAVLVSRTDRAGTIVYANDDFYTTSGYSEAILLKQPHNIVRHPDMPAEAFRDLWRTLESGRPWSGVVKNRRQNGDFYWVRANVNPHSNGGYRSVRVAPSREEIAAATTLYAKMRTDDSIMLSEGRAFKKGWLTSIRLRAENVSISTRMLLMGGLALLAFTVAVSLACLSLNDASETMAGILSQTSGANMQDVRRLLEENYAAALARQRTGIAISVLCALTGLVSLIVGSAVYRRLKRGFVAAQSVAKSIADGNLTCAISTEGRDEIGQLVAQITIMRNNLQELIGDLGTSIEKLSVDSAGLRDVAADSAGVAVNQSEDSAEIAAAVEELSVSIDQVEEHAAEANKITEKTTAKASESVHMIEKIAGEIQDIAEAVQRTASEMRTLETISNEISSIMKVIGEVADQTNLLALNAAIEAARAGDQGRGFAVVADEVRNLAEKTNRSSKEINQMISNVQNAARAVVVTMENGVERVNAGVTLSREAAVSMSSISEDQAGVTHAVDGIAGGLSEQAVAAREIAVKIEKITQETEVLADKARKTNEAAESVELLTSRLWQLADNFHVA